MCPSTAPLKNKMRGREQSSNINSFGTRWRCFFSFMLRSLYPQRNRAPTHWMGWPQSQTEGTATGEEKNPYLSWANKSEMRVMLIYYSVSVVWMYVYSSRLMLYYLPQQTSWQSGLSRYLGGPRFMYRPKDWLFWVFFWFFSDPPGKCLDSTIN
jgi:hypothetical protein